MNRNVTWTGAPSKDENYPIQDRDADAERRRARAGKEGTLRVRRKKVGHLASLINNSQKFHRGSYLENKTIYLLAIAEVRQVIQFGSTHNCFSDEKRILNGAIPRKLFTYIQLPDTKLS